MHLYNPYLQRNAVLGLTLNQIFANMNNEYGGWRDVTLQPPKNPPMAPIPILKSLSTGDNNQTQMPPK